MPTDPDNINAKGKKVDITRLLQLMNKKAFGEGKLLPISPSEWTAMQKLAANQKGFKETSSGSGSQLSTYGRWLNTPSNQASELANRLSPLPPHMQNRATWWGAGGESVSRSLHLDPVRIVDRAARDLLSGRITASQLIQRGKDFYPTYTDSHGEKTDIPFKLKTFFDPRAARSVKNYVQKVLDEKVGPPVKPQPKVPFKGPI